MFKKGYRCILFGKEFILALYATSWLDITRPEERVAVIQHAGTGEFLVVSLNALDQAKESK